MHAEELMRHVHMPSDGGRGEWRFLTMEDGKDNAADPPQCTCFVESSTECSHTVKNGVLHYSPGALHHTGYLKTSKRNFNNQCWFNNQCGVVPQECNVAPHFKQCNSWQDNKRKQRSQCTVEAKRASREQEKVQKLWSLHKLGITLCSLFMFDSTTPTWPTWAMRTYTLARHGTRHHAHV